MYTESNTHLRDREYWESHVTTWKERTDRRPTTWHFALLLRRVTKNTPLLPFGNCKIRPTVTS